MFLCDSFRMVQEPVADVEIQCLAEPWSCVVSAHPAKLVGLHEVQARDAFLISFTCWHASTVALGSMQGVALCQKGSWGAAVF